MFHRRQCSRMAAAMVVGAMALPLSVAVARPASAEYRAMVMPISSDEGVTGQVGAYCSSGADHNGIDISADTGDRVVAAYGGTVQRLTHYSYGTYIVLKHINGYSTLYAHLSGYASGAADGSYVDKGQLIGYAGSTGNSTGAHLHFEVRINDVSQSGINIAFPCGSHTVAGTPIDWTFPGLPAGSNGGPGQLRLR